MVGTKSIPNYFYHNRKKGGCQDTSHKFLRDEIKR